MESIGLEFIFYRCEFLVGINDFFRKSGFVFFYFRSDGFVTERQYLSGENRCVEGCVDSYRSDGDSGRHLHDGEQGIAFLANSSTSAGVRCADKANISNGISHSSSSLAAFSMIGRSDVLPIIILTIGFIININCL